MIWVGNKGNDPNCSFLPVWDFTPQFVFTSFFLYCCTDAFHFSSNYLIPVEVKAAQVRVWCLDRPVHWTFTQICFCSVSRSWARPAASGGAFKCLSGAHEPSQPAGCGREGAVSKPSSHSALSGLKPNRDSGFIRKCQLSFSAKKILSVSCQGRTPPPSDLPSKNPQLFPKHRWSLSTFITSDKPQTHSDLSYELFWATVLFMSVDFIIHTTTY